MVYIGIRGHAIALDSSTGEEKWRRTLPGNFVHMMMLGGALYAGAGGALFRLDPATGEVEWENPLNGMGVVDVILDEGNLFVTSAGEVYCVDPGTGAIRWHNPLKWFGTGPATMASPGGNTGRRSTGPADAPVMT